MRWSETLGHQMPADYSPPIRYPALAGLLNKLFA